MTAKHMQAEVSFVCPFCGKGCSANSDPRRGAIGVVHGLPMCKKFEELEPQEFMRACNLRFVN